MSSRLDRVFDFVEWLVCVVRGHDPLPPLPRWPTRCRRCGKDLNPYDPMHAGGAKRDDEEGPWRS